MQDATDLGVIELGNDGALGAFHGITTVASGATLTVGEGTLAWSGSELAMVWATETSVAYVGLFDSTLTPIGTPTQISANGTHPVIVWAKDRFGTTWCAGGTSYGIGEIGSDGALGQFLTSGTVCGQSLIATTSSYLVGAYIGGEPATLAITAPLFNGDTLSGYGTALSNNSMPELRYATTTAGATYMLEAAQIGAGDGGAQLLDDGGPAVGEMAALPMFGTNPLDYVAMAPIGSVLRVVGATSNAHVVTTDFDPTTQQFSAPIDLGALPGGISSYPTIAAGPGRIAIDYNFTVGSQGMARVIQQCN
jgi:hypothetical protein